MELTSLFAPIGRGFHGSALSGQGFGHTGKPVLSTRADSPKKVLHKDFDSKHEAPETQVDSGSSWGMVVGWLLDVRWMVLDGLLNVKI